MWKHNFYPGGLLSGLTILPNNFLAYRFSSTIHSMYVPTPSWRIRQEPIFGQFNFAFYAHMPRTVEWGGGGRPPAGR
jgi:hypothetical protein